MIVAVRRLFATETREFFVLLGATIFLVLFGLVMVLSSSAVTSYTDDDDFFAGFARQGLFAALGVPLMLVASRMPSSVWRRWSQAAVIVGVVLQVLVIATPLGIDFNGNKNWLNLGAFSIQPSEITKVALVIWLASVLASRVDRLRDWKQVALPVVPVAGVAILLVLAGRDLGTAIIMVAIVLGALFFAGVRLLFLAVPVGAIGALLPVVALSTNSRSDRIAVWLDQCSSAGDLAGPCWQTVHGWWALAAGGVFGVGLGNSKAKWSWLPEADNDFIFAIIGEELGLLGAIVVLALFTVVAITMMQIIRKNNDPFARIATSAVMVWIVVQAFVNIAVVLGVLPVLGVPLPLMSAGGTALITSLFAIGIVLSFARHREDPAEQTVSDAQVRAPRSRPAGQSARSGSVPVFPTSRSRTAAPAPAGGRTAPRSGRQRHQGAAAAAVAPGLDARRDAAARASAAASARRRAKTTGAAATARPEQATERRPGRRSTPWAGS